MQYLKMDRDFLAGLWLSSGSVTAAEIAGAAGFDWLLIDGEHGLASESGILEILRALAASTACPVVRIPSHDSPLLGRVLDFGAGGIMAPGVESADEARQLVQRMRYPPRGKRGLTASSRAAGHGSQFKTYFSEANEKLALIAQIETADGVAHADEIAAVDGVSALFVGHSDLSLNLGVFGDWEHDALKAAESRVIAACRKSGKLPGLLLKSGQSTAPYREKGFRLIALGTDSGLLRSGCASLLAGWRQAPVT